MGEQRKVEDGNAPASAGNLGEILNDFSIDAIIAIDTKYNVVAWNRTAALAYGYSKKHALGKPLFQLIPELEKDTETIKAIELSLKGYKTFVASSKLCMHRQHRENHYIPLQDDEGTVIGVMNIVHDVAHRIKAEQQLQYLNEELERRYRQLKSTSEELASFTYITSNKIKEPIRHLYTGIEHLIKVEAGHLTDSGKATFRRMQSSLSKMDLLLDDVLSIAQISILQKVETDINVTELAKEVAEDIEKKTETRVNIIVKELCIVKGHRNYLYLLLYNLLGNAIKFNGNSVAEIRISCEKVVLNEPVTQSLPYAEYYRITITDNGIGIDRADTERIFRMFEKLHDKNYKGSGIGLTIAKKIMEAHDGFITVESVPGVGSSFHCFFPVTDAEE
jgi:PAS domain S-box-containing protein